MSKQPAALRALPDSARTVIVACKVPNGIWMQLQTVQKRPEMTRDGMTMAEYNVFGGKKYYINGPAYPQGGMIPPDFPERPPIMSGYAVTYGIPAPFWETWAEQNKNAQFLKQEDGEIGAVFAAETIEEVRAIAKEHGAYLTGLEAISQDKDKEGRLSDRRLPKPLNASLLKLATEPHPLG